MTDIIERLQDYLSSGGLINPELMEHDKVRDMIIDVRDEIERLRANIERLRAALNKIMRNDPEGYEASIARAALEGKDD